MHSQCACSWLSWASLDYTRKLTTTCNDAVSTCQEIMAKLPKDLPSSLNLAIEGSRTAIHVSMQQLPISLLVTAQANLKGSYT